MMSPKVRGLLGQMAALEEELLQAVQEQRSADLLQSQTERPRRHFLRWLVIDRPQNLITGPIIYSMVLPMLLLDVCISLYQFSCFPIYGIRRVVRRDYMVFDRQQLEYLDFIEKFHCAYCAYGNGLMAYATEVVARTEEYFCPIKHARQVLGAHARYAHFLAYGDAADYETRLEKFRTELGQPKPPEEG